MGTDLLTLLAKIKMHLRNELTRMGKGKEAVVDLTLGLSPGCVRWPIREYAQVVSAQQITLQ